MPDPQLGHETFKSLPNAPMPEPQLAPMPDLQLDRQTLKSLKRKRKEDVKRILGRRVEFEKDLMDVDIPEDNRLPLWNILDPPLRLGAQEWKEIQPKIPVVDKLRYRYTEPLVRGKRLRLRIVAKNTNECHRKPPPVRRPNLQLPDDIPEIQRLMKREIKPVAKSDDYVCLACYSQDHSRHSCPYLKEIKPEDVLAPEFDRACLGCGTIGLSCCSMGSFAVLKRCLFCLRNGHWYWEERCPKDFRPNLELRAVWKSIKNGTSFEQRPFKIPDFNKKEDEEELRKLMERKIPLYANDKDCCDVCYSKDHPYYDCTFLDFIPDDKCVGPKFDEVCLGCGKIGERCCSMGAYAILKECSLCGDSGHWYWEGRCNKSPHSRTLAKCFESFKMSIKNKVPSSEESPLQDITDSQQLEPSCFA
ncbi:hypothetical protein ACHQM5_029036 [Ranunculus cassubicifolius]